jgi:hypothetical protein
MGCSKEQVGSNSKGDFRAFVRLSLQKHRMVRADGSKRREICTGRRGPCEAVPDTREIQIHRVDSDQPEHLKS